MTMIGDDRVTEGVQSMLHEADSATCGERRPSCLRSLPASPGQRRWEWVGLASDGSVTPHAISVMIAIQYVFTLHAMSTVHR